MRIEDRRVMIGSMPYYAKKTRRLERVVKGFANHRRIEILMLLEKEPELSVTEIAGCLNINLKTASEHIRRLAISGLVLKRNQGNAVRHAPVSCRRIYSQVLKNIGIDWLGRGGIEKRYFLL